MKLDISDTAQETAMLLGLYDSFNEIGTRKNADILTTNEEIERIVESVNIAAQEIAEDFFPLLAEETVSSNENSQVAFSAFENQVHMVLEAFDSEGKKTTFRVFDEFLKMPSPSSAFCFHYTYLPEHADEKEEIDVAPQVTKRMVLFGACSAFCFWNQLFDEAKMWQDRFLDAVAEAKKRDRRIRKQRLPKTWLI